MSESIHKSHNVTVLIYHLVFPAKYRSVVFEEHVDKVLKEVCLDIEKRYQVKFLEIGTDQDHVHFLIQSIMKIANYPCSNTPSACGGVVYYQSFHQTPCTPLAISADGVFL